MTATIRRLDPKLVDLLKSLKAGDRIKLTQTVRVGGKVVAQFEQSRLTTCDR